MSTPRLVINLDHLSDNAATLVGRLGRRGIRVSGVTKAVLGSPEVAWAMVRGGVAGLADSRIENIEVLRAAGITAPITLIRSPMLSQCERVVQSADVSLNSELRVVRALSRAAGAQGRTHGVVLMVELGDLREGMLAGDLEAAAQAVVALPGIALRGIGVNLACQNGAAPSGETMSELSGLANAIESALDVRLDVVSGGNSANLEWALGAGAVGRVNDLRLGESILLGCETLQGNPISGLHADAFTLVGEVIEAKRKPSQPWGLIGPSTFTALSPVEDRGVTGRVIVALGQQDIDPAGLVPPVGYSILGASSDHLVLDAGSNPLPTVGAELHFGLDYRALLRAMTSPFVTRVFTGGMPVAAPDQASDRSRVMTASR